MDRGKTLLVFGVGKLGGAVVDLLARSFPEHRYVLVSRSSNRAEKRANLTRYICSQWGQYPTVEFREADLLDVVRTADLLSEVRPDVVFNATTPFPWWALDSLPVDLRKLSYDAGLGMWAALDCLLPMRLEEALTSSTCRPVFVNGCYPDMVNAFLATTQSPPLVGIGNFSNLVPGLRLAFAQHLNVAAQELYIQLFAHHYVSLNAPTVGGCAGAPYVLQISWPQGRVRFEGVDDTPFALLKKYASRVRGLDGQGVTASSAGTVLAAFLNNVGGQHHTPGPLGLVGGYAVTISDSGSVSVDLPDEVDLAEVVEANRRAQRHDGLSSVEANFIRLTQRCSDALALITGVQVETVDRENAQELSQQIVASLNKRYDLELSV